MKATKLLKFSDPNSKLRKLREKGYRIATFSLPAGWSCPAANLCKAKVSRDGKLSDGASVQFRCFAASDEAQYRETRDQRWHNFDLLKGLNTDAMARLIGASLPKNANAIRIHVSGDFYNPQYFLAWCKVASQHPEVIFYAYTKSINFWVANRDSVPSNLVLTGSFGGFYDHLIGEHNLKSARVVFSIDGAKGLPIDHDDTHAMDKDCHAFALLVHHTQPKGSEASKAVQALKGLGSYSTNQTVNKQRAELVDAIAA